MSDYIINEDGSISRSFQSTTIVFHRKNGFMGGLVGAEMLIDNVKVCDIEDGDIIKQTILAKPMMIAIKKKYSNLYALTRIVPPQCEKIYVHAKINLSWNWSRFFHWKASIKVEYA